MVKDTIDPFEGELAVVNGETEDSPRNLLPKHAQIVDVLIF
ncbi:hypothetical protein [Peribacillus sp. NPDC096540]